MAGGDAEPRCCWVRASRAAVLPAPNMAAGQPQPAPCPTSGPLPFPLPVHALPHFRRRRPGAMRGAGGTRDPAGLGLGASRLGAAPAACPWGCVLGPGGWSGGTGRGGGRGIPGQDRRVPGQGPAATGAAL